MKPFVLITGVSSGIGLDCARLLVDEGYRVIGTVRRQQDGLRIRAMLGDDFTPLLLDVTDSAALDGAVGQIGAPVARVSQAVLHGLRTPRPKPRYPLNPMWHLAALLPTRWIDRILARKLALPPRI